MSDIFAPFVINLCSGVEPAYLSACKKSMEAAYIQSGTKKELSTVQTSTENEAKSQEKIVLGDNTFIVNGVVGAGYLAYKKNANVTLPNFGICNKLSTEIKPNSILFKFGWKW